MTGFNDSFWCVLALSWFNSYAPELVLMFYYRVNTRVQMFYFFIRIMIVSWFKILIPVMIVVYFSYCMLWLHIGKHFLEDPFQENHGSCTTPYNANKLQRQRHISFMQYNRSLNQNHRSYFIRGNIYFKDLID